MTYFFKPITHKPQTSRALANAQHPNRTVRNEKHLYRPLARILQNDKYFNHKNRPLKAHKWLLYWVFCTFNLLHLTTIPRSRRALNDQKNAIPLWYLLGCRLYFLKLFFIKRQIIFGLITQNLRNFYCFLFNIIRHIVKCRCTSNYNTTNNIISTCL